MTDSQYEWTVRITSEGGDNRFDYWQHPDPPWQNLWPGWFWPGITKVEIIPYSPQHGIGWYLRPH